MNRPSPAVRELNDLALQRDRQRYPDIPPGCLAPYHYRDYSANGLTKCVLAWLKLHGHQAERIAVTGRVLDKRKCYTDVLGHRREIGGLKWIPTSGQPGSADISATIIGRSVKIEIKYGPDRQSSAQKEYQRQVEQSGGIYLIIRTFQEFRDWYAANVKQ